MSEPTPTYDAPPSPRWTTHNGKVRFAMALRELHATGLSLAELGRIHNMQGGRVAELIHWVGIQRPGRRTGDPFWRTRKIAPGVSRCPGDEDNRLAAQK